MRRNKMLAREKAQKKVVHHTPTERIHMARLKRKNGPSGKRRAERRKLKQVHVPVAEAVDVTDAMIVKCDGDHGMPACADPECWQRDVVNG